MLVSHSIRRTESIVETSVVKYDGGVDEIGCTFCWRRHREIREEIPTTERNRNQNCL
jgi:hypothetical protein